LGERRGERRRNKRGFCAWPAISECPIVPDPSTARQLSGKLAGTVEGGKLSGKSASVTIMSCGHADVTIDGDTDSVTLDRCAGI
jgi:hypothetical protein